MGLCMCSNILVSPVSINSLPAELGMKIKRNSTNSTISMSEEEENYDDF